MIDQYWLDGLPVWVAPTPDTGFVFWLDGLPVSGVFGPVGSPILYYIQQRQQGT